MSMGELNRNSLVLYLRDIRDLEIAKRKIKYLYNQDKQHHQRIYNQLTIPRKIEEPVVKVFSAEEKMFPLLMVTFLLCALIWSIGTGNWIGALLFGGGTAFFFMMLIAMSSEEEDRKKKLLEVRKKNQNELNRVNSSVQKKKAQKIQDSWQNRERFWRSEYSKVESLLQSYYSMNILPSQFRNLAAVYYLEDYLSTSQESLRDALLQRTITDGIEQILKKLDAVIDSIEFEAMQTRILAAQNQEIIQHNSKALRSLQNIEDNSADAAYYAGLASNYARANAFFSLATYLKA